MNMHIDKARYDPQAADVKNLRARVCRRVARPNRNDFAIFHSDFRTRERADGRKHCATNQLSLSHFIHLFARKSYRFSTLSHEFTIPY